MSIYLWFLVSWTAVAATLLLGFLACCRAALRDDLAWDLEAAVQADVRAGAGGRRSLSAVRAPELPVPLLTAAGVSS